MTVAALESRFSERSYRIFRRDALITSVQIVTEALIARALGPAAMGVWLILRLIPAYAEVFGRSQVDSAAVYLLGTRKHAVGKITFAIIVISLASAAFTLGMFLLSERWLFATFLRQAATERQAVLAVLAYVPFRFLAICYNKLLLSDEDVRGYNAAAALLTLVPAVLGAVLVTVFHLGVTGLAVALIVGGAAAVGYSATRIHARHPITPHHDVGIVRDLLAFGFKVYLATVVQFLYVYSSATLVVLTLPVAQVAFFRMAQERALLLSRVPTAVATLLFPRVARLGDALDNARALTVRSARLTLLVLIGLGAGVMLVAYPAVLILYGPAFVGVVVPLILFIPGVVVDASSGLLMQYYMGLGRVWTVVALTTIGVLIQLGLLLAGLKYGGLRGGVVGVTVAYFIVAGIRSVVFCVREAVPARDLRIRRDDIDFVVGFIRRQAQSIRERLRARPSGVDASGATDKPRASL